MSAKENLEQQVTFNLFDYFAAKAMSSFIEGSDVMKFTGNAPAPFMQRDADAISERSMMMAESMMKARAQWQNRKP